jgi:hypothetical protein
MDCSPTRDEGALLTDAPDDRTWTWLEASIEAHARNREDDVVAAVRRCAGAVRGVLRLAELIAVEGGPDGAAEIAGGRIAGVGCRRRRRRWWWARVELPRVGGAPIERGRGAFISIRRGVRCPGACLVRCLHHTGIVGASWASAGPKIIPRTATRDRTEGKREQEECPTSPHMSVTP